MTGLEARLALQKGREEAQCLLKLAQTAIQQPQQQQQQQPPLRSTSFPPRVALRPIGPQPSQVCPQPAKTINVVQGAVHHPSLICSQPVPVAEITHGTLNSSASIPLPEVHTEAINKPSGQTIVVCMFYYVSSQKWVSVISSNTSEYTSFSSPVMWPQKVSGRGQS